MKKLIIALLSILTLCSCVKQKPSFTDTQWKIEKKHLLEKAPTYTVNVSYPQMISVPKTTSEPLINKRIEKFANDNMASFRENLPTVTEGDIHDFPLEMRKNILFISYSSYLGHIPQGTIVSFRFNIEKLHYGRFTPSQDYVVFNYNLSDGEPLSLATLFKPDYPYLKTLSDYCKKVLAKKLAPDMPWLSWKNDSLGPDKKNYALWALDKKGILVIITKDQLEPYSLNSETILVPYSVFGDGLIVVEREYKGMGKNPYAKN